MKKLIALILISIINFSYSQTKYLIYFKDKGITPQKILSKTSIEYQQAVNSLSERSIERRKKTMGENFITYEDVPIYKKYLDEVKTFGIRIENNLKWFNAASAYLTEEQKNKISSLSFIKKIEPVHTLYFDRDRLSQTSESTLKKVSNINLDYGNSFRQLNLIDVPKVHSKGINGKGILIGILDSGFRWKTHEALQNAKVIAEHDFVFDDNNTANQPGDVPNQDEHGTAVFSMIGGFKDGTMIGSAYGASFVLAKTENIASETHVEEDNYAAALEWMDSLGVDLTTSSLGYNIFDKPETSYTYEDMNGNTTIVTKAANLAFQRGIVVFTAAGNEGNNSWHYIIAPADGFNVIAVGAVDNNNIVASFSSRGPTSDGRIKPDITAQGVNVFGARPGGFYASGNGTSFATPLAAGAGALLLSAFPYLTNKQAREIILETAGNFQSPNNDIGYGLMSASKSISFPNLEIVNGKFIIHKIFLEDKINPQTVKINYSSDGNNFITENLSFDDTLKYKFNLPEFQNSQEIQFYFTFEDSSFSKKEFREPLTDNYVFNYGDLNIFLKAAKPSITFEGIITDAYPNPFLPVKNSIVKINFKSNGNENLQAVIVNSLGEKVKSYNFISTANQNKNIIEWDGKNDNGVECASGVYLVLINLNGNQYARKLVLLR